MIIPEFLQQGDKVGVVASAKKVNESNTQKGIEILSSWGLKVITGRYLYNSFHQFAGTDSQRTEDLQNMINDPGIKAIFLARGGYGTTRIIDSIDFEPLRNNPKWICGFSDATALHLQLYKLGISSLHAPMPAFFHRVDGNSLNFLKQYIFGERECIAIESHRLNQFGQTSGKLVGGNLSIICNTIGTPSEIETKGNILFIEDVGEKLYHLDRMMVQLKRAGFLNDLAGLVVGQFSDMQDDRDTFGLDSNEIIYSHVKDFNFPVAFNFPIGHTSQNYPIPIGSISSFSVGENKVELY